MYNFIFTVSTISIFVLFYKKKQTITIIISEKW